MSQDIQKERDIKKQVFELEIPIYKAIITCNAAKEEPYEVFGMLERKDCFYFDGIHKEHQKTYKYFITPDGKDGMNNSSFEVDPFTIKEVSYQEQVELNLIYKTSDEKVSSPQVSMSMDSRL